MSEVWLLGFPVALGARQREHQDELVRELMLMTMGDRPPEAPARLLQLAELLTSRYSAELDEPARFREQAEREGKAQVDLRYPVREETLAVVQAYRQVQQDMDDYCRAGDLLVLARPPELVALQQWLLGEFERQISGEPPQPWPGPL